MNVLSLFDGISAGQLALLRAGVEVDNYYASEIDPYAISATQIHFPDTVQLGDVREVTEKKLRQPIDLLIGGSPCQGFTHSGLKLNFEDPRSKLFFEYVRVLKEVNPRYFLLENVRMKQEWQDIISEHLGCEPILIDSALFSAQHRERLYWTNIPVGDIPEMPNVTLKDIMFSDAVFFKRFPDSYVICLHNLYGGFKEKENRVFSKKSPTLRTPAGGGHIPSVVLEERGMLYAERLLGRTDFEAVSNLFKKTNYKTLQELHLIRKLHPVECERLQTFPDNYTMEFSNTQRYKMLGNAWTVNVVKWIFSHIKE